jgi:hypothetical protein
LHDADPQHDRDRQKRPPPASRNHVTPSCRSPSFLQYNHRIEQFSHHIACSLPFSTSASGRRISR